MAATKTTTTDSCPLCKATPDGDEQLLQHVTLCSACGTRCVVVAVLGVLVCCCCPPLTNFKCSAVAKMKAQVEAVAKPSLAQLPGVLFVFAFCCYVCYLSLWLCSLFCCLNSFLCRFEREELHSYRGPGCTEAREAHAHTHAQRQQAHLRARDYNWRRPARAERSAEDSGGRKQVHTQACRGGVFVHQLLCRASSVLLVVLIRFVDFFVVVAVCCLHLFSPECDVLIEQKERGVVRANMYGHVYFMQPVGTECDRLLRLGAFWFHSCCFAVVIVFVGFVLQSLSLQRRSSAKVNTLSLAHQETHPHTSTLSHARVQTPSCPS